MTTQNITLSIPKDILLKVKIMAVKQGTSISGLLTDVLTAMVARDEGYRVAQQRHLVTLENQLTLETNGVISWAREQLHER